MGALTEDRERPAVNGQELQVGQTGLCETHNVPATPPVGKSLCLSYTIITEVMGAKRWNKIGHQKQQQSLNGEGTAAVGPTSAISHESNLSHLVPPQDGRQF